MSPWRQASKESDHSFSSEANDEECAVGPAVFRGLLFAAVPSVLMWWGIIELASRFW